MGIYLVRIKVTLTPGIFGQCGAPAPISGSVCGVLVGWLSDQILKFLPIGLECMFGFGDYECLIAIGWFRWVKNDIQQTSSIT